MPDYPCFDLANKVPYGIVLTLAKKRPCLAPCIYSQEFLIVLKGQGMGGFTVIQIYLPLSALKLV